MTAPARREGIVSEITTLLGRGTSFEGKLTFEGTVRVDGKLKGEVFSDDVLIIGEGALVEAEIDIGEIIVQGTIVGNIRARRSIEVLAPGRVKGDIHTPSLQIEKGVIFEGRSFMEGMTGGAPSAGAPMNKPTAVPAASSTSTSPMTSSTSTAAPPARPAETPKPVK